MHKIWLIDNKLLIYLFSMKRIGSCITNPILRLTSFIPEKDIFQNNMIDYRKHK